MDVVLIFNGLGNQMSQYAFYLAKRRASRYCYAIYDRRSKMNHNGYELDRLFGIKNNSGIRFCIFYALYKVLNSGRIAKFKGVVNKLFMREIREAKNYDFNPQNLKSGHSWGVNFYWGGWHSEKNFLSVEDKVRQTFRFPEIKDRACQQIAENIKNVKNSVSLHVRRGDYLTIQDDDFYQFGGVSTQSYYKSAVARIKSMFSDAIFFVFSNDLAYCHETFDQMGGYVIVDCNEGINSWRDMYLMSLCRHHIIANSTFSWWGAWLSDKEGVTICPSRFIRTVETKDIYPDRWIKIDAHPISEDEA